MKLILVESPTKARTLTKFLGEPYRVEATMGHIRDLPKSTLGVDVDHDFTPSYIIPRDKKKRVNELVALAKKADEIVLASDPDREGEAIAWHMAEILGDNKTVRQKDDKKKKKEKEILLSDSKASLPVLPSQFQRITFHEITKSAIDEALTHPGTIDMKLVDSQQARRVLDRLVGYKLSPLLWKKLSRRWLSAGRVQSVAVRLIVEREREIEKFTKEQFFTVSGTFVNASQETAVAQLVSKDGDVYEKTLSFDLFDGKYTTATTTIKTSGQAEAIIHDLKTPFTVSSVDKKEIKRSPAAPYTTSTLQQDAGRRLYYSSKRTMQLAQKLYEEGYITYHRTDSVNLSQQFTDQARTYIKNTFGQEYVPGEAKRYQTKSKVAQEAHEAIRPTQIDVAGEQLKENPEFNHDHLKLYDLIRKRALASQMKEALFDSTTIVLSTTNGYVFQCQGSVVKFDGYLKIIGRDAAEEEIIPVFTVGEHVDLKTALPEAHETNPPPRYSESSLIKTLEEKDIGRPSTYAPTISTIIDRQYVKKEDLPGGRQGKRLIPTELGILVNDFLVNYFPDVMSLPFTAQMEDALDEIATGQKQWVPVMESFWKPFSQALDHATDQAETIKLAVEPLDEKCPLDGGQLVIKTGRYGKFVACSNFPACKYTRQYGETVDDKVCPKCGGAIVVRRSRRGKVFYGCSNYPTCDFAAWKKEDIK